LNNTSPHFAKTKLKPTAEDLKEIGVAIVGHRRKILSAISELFGSSAAVANPQPPAEPASPAAVAERRLSPPRSWTSQAHSSAASGAPR
jgi:hypothetical protein